MNAYEMIMFFYNKDEHYPVSDEFIEKYQQLNGGYLDFARKTGHCIDKRIHEPNQKWHLFESWLFQTVAEKKCKNIEEIVSNGFKCPELLLWMAEAAGVEKEYVLKASNLAGIKIDEMRRESPGTSYSAAAVKYLNDEMKKEYGKNFWTMIVEKVK